MNEMEPQDTESIAYPNVPTQPDWYFISESGNPICTFIPEVQRLINVVNSDGVVIKKRIQLRMQFGDDTSTETTVLLSDLDQIDWFSVDYRCIVNSCYRNAKRYIGNYIRAGVSKAPTETQYCLDRLGIHRIGTEILFVAGDRIITRSSNDTSIPNVELEQIPFRLDIDPAISKETSFAGMKELINLSPVIGRILMAHVISGFTRAAFKEAGFIPCAVLVIVGESGMLKSHYVPHMVQLYNRADGIGPVTRFNSTKRYIEDILYEYSECTAVIDDLHTAESTGIRRRNENTAEEIIRRIGDDMGRGRKEGHASIQRSFRGNLVFIGEYMIGKASTVPRALAVNLTQKPNGAVFDKYQRQQPLLVSTFYYYFVQWYIDNFNAIRDGIDKELSRHRQTTANSNTHGRLNDTKFYLQTAYMIFLEFCKDSGFASLQDTNDEYRDFSYQLNKLIAEQQVRF